MHQLCSLYHSDTRSQKILESLQTDDKTIVVRTNTSFDSILALNTAQNTDLTVIIVSEDYSSAEALFHDISILKTGISTCFFKSSFIVKNNVLTQNHSRYLGQIADLESIRRGQTKIVVTYPEAAIEKFLVTNDSEHLRSITVGEKLSLSSIIEYLELHGYERSGFVYEAGHYAIRGNILDIFSFAYTQPVRVEMFDIEVESIRHFDIENQLSVSDLQKVTISTNPKLRINKNAEVRTILDFCKGNILWSEESERLEKKISQIIKEYSELENDLDEGLENTIIQKSTIKGILKPRKQIVLQEGLNSEIEHTPLIHKNFNKLHQTIEEFQMKDYDIIILSDDNAQEERYRQIFIDLGGERNFKHIQGEIQKGFVDHHQKRVVLTTHEIFAKRLYTQQGHSNNLSAQAQLLKSMREFVPGDFVTHLDHGVGRFSGLEKIDVGGKQQEAVRLIYANNDMLYVHVNSLHKISKFVGKDGSEPRLNKLGSDTWENTKRKTKKKIKDIAEDLIKLYAKRKASVGFTFSPDSYLQYELETSFEYEDTPDQARAAMDVKADMEKEIPMDRLVCGDVGFGKTEIAIRAAFKAVCDSKQVAVLVPTTLLAFQHYLTFKKRLGDLPCRVEFINRFKTTKEKTNIYKDLEGGKIDILIGTHAIVSKNVKFKDLGLLVVDEEQKFGVQVKERLKELKLNVDTLTMTATPIPRTLQFSLLGARDYSLIQTPPPSRQAIYTEVTVFDPDYIKEIIENEAGRGGQVFFVHNKVKDLFQLKEMLHKIIPDIDIAYAHGQLDGDVIEKTLIDFIDKKYDVLLSTNIIESGIDISNANTIIINNAHQFGLSDLHQLRGRVGRSDRKAFCYLLSPPFSTLTTEAKQRLNAMENNSELGSGFQIAMRDLDLRGAGNLLGAEQSGFISDIGYETFMKILDEAITELKEGEYKELYQEENKNKIINYSRDCQIETDNDMFIPDSYIPNSQDRLKVYSDLNNVKDENELNDYLKNLKDIHGKLPKQINEITESIKLKWIATQLGIERIILKNNKLKCILIQNQDASFYQTERFGLMIDYIQANPEGISFKQSPQYIVIEFNNVRNTPEATTRLAKMRNQEVVV
jgi:transcription-repair coupling factor (superfamily II helicase)